VLISPRDEAVKTKEEGENESNDLERISEQT
jgi:hypothetical protein